MSLSGLTFGIYPLSVAGTPFGLAVGPEDNYEKIQLSLRDLRGESKKLLPRNYLIYTKEWESKMLSNADRYLKFGLLGDLTIGCGDWTNLQEPDIELDNWLSSGGPGSGAAFLGKTIKSWRKNIYGFGRFCRT